MTNTLQPRDRLHAPFPIYDESDSLPPTPLPPNHFLSIPAPSSPSLQPATAFNSSAEEEWSATARPDTTTLAAADYDVSVISGFLPPEEPIQSLIGVGGGWDELEKVLEEALEEVKSKGDQAYGRLGDELRAKVVALPTPSLTPLTTLPLLRRAHVALSFLAHLYLHSTFPALTVVPVSLSVPWLLVSDKLGLPPVLTYADTVLWNWRFLDPSRGLRADNVTIHTTFTSTPSEISFFLLSLLSELYAPQLLRLMSSTLDEAFFADRLALTRISDHLLRISSIILDLGNLMVDATKGHFGPVPVASLTSVTSEARAEIGPGDFYWNIRPWFNAGKRTFLGGGEFGEDVELNYGGPSAGQSSLVHALDLFLEVDHAPRTPPPTPSTSTPAPQSISLLLTTPTRPVARTLSKSPNSPLPLHDATFMTRMSHYMPSPHRSFLTHLSTLSSMRNPYPSSSPPSVRLLATTYTSASSNLAESYNTAVREMKIFRDKHFLLVHRFIMGPSRSEPAVGSVWREEWEVKQTEKKKEDSGDALKGTGGTQLVRFLKECRTRTEETMLLLDPLVVSS